jgi:hypothetical protein
LKSPGGGKVETVLTLATQRLPDLFRWADLAAGISLYQSELSISRIAADEMNCNTLMLVSGKFLKERVQIALASFLKHRCDEIEQSHLVNPACFVLRIDVGESRRDQYGAQISAGHVFFQPEAFSGWDYGIACAVKYENWNAKIRNLAMGREGSEFGLIGVEGSE